MLPERAAEDLNRRLIVEVHRDIDNFAGLGTSVSHDNGRTWSALNLLYDSGRHHPSFVVLPSGDILMAYIVRCGYPVDPEGFPQFGIEAVLSHDHGQTWDMAHRFILDRWSGTRIAEDDWWSAPQSTSTLLLPDGWLLTAYGTGYRCDQLFTDWVLAFEVTSLLLLAAMVGAVILAKRSID